MHRIFQLIIPLSLLTGFAFCPNRFIKLEIAQNNFCVLANPDTSISNIKLRDAKSTIAVLGKETKLTGDSTHRFYSKNRNQILSMTVHAGDYHNEVSVFEVTYNGTNALEYRNTNIESFETEKGIHLGVFKKQVINKLGKCYSSFIRPDTEIVTYRLERPLDSKTKLLSRQNMQAYYSAYYFKANKLVKFEFGFEYP